MSLIKATTPTSAGFAQAFDLSGFVEHNLAMERDTKVKDLARREKLAKSMMVFDPKGMMPNHINVLSQLNKEYVEYVGENEVAIMNPGENMKAYQGKIALENEMKTLAAGSIQMNQDYNRALPIMLQDKSFTNPENSLFMEGLTAEGTVEQWREGNLMQPVMEGLQRNYMVDEDAIIDTLHSRYIKDIEGMDKTSDPDFYLNTVTERLSTKEADSYLRGLYGERSRDGGDLRGEYKTFEDFKETMVGRIVTDTSTSYVKKDDDDDDAGQEKWDIAFQGLDDPRTHIAGETSVIDDEIYGTYDEKAKEKAQKNTAAGKQGGIPMKESSKAYRLKQSQSYAPNTESGGGTSITLDIDKAINLTTGKAEDIPKSVNKMKVMQVGLFNIATQTIAMPRKGQADLIIAAGDPIPKRDEEDFSMSQEDYDEMLENKTEEQEMAKVYASSNPLDLIEHMSMEEILKLTSKEGTTNKMLLVDYSLVHEILAGVFDQKVDRKGAYQQERNEYLYGNQKAY